jgi:aspartate racemase
MAEYYVRELRDAQPNGPYRLAGMSFGGIVAFEMARILHDTGAMVDLVALFDSYPSDVVRWLKAHPYKCPRTGFLAAAARRAQRFARMSNAERALYVTRNVRRVAGQAVAASRHWSSEHGSTNHQPASTRNAVVTAFYRAVDEFEMRPYAGRVLLFRASDEHVWHPDLPDDYGWSRWAQGGVEVERVPGAHLTMLAEPHVQVLAERLSARLRSSQCGQTYDFAQRFSRTAARRCLG